MEREIGKIGSVSSAAHTLNMDANKLQVLRDLPYTVHQVCGLCRHGVFPNNNWGTCSRNEYTHQKHTGAPRQLSIVKYGSCQQFEVNDAAASALGGFQEFLAPPSNR